MPSSTPMVAQQESEAARPRRARSLPPLAARIASALASLERQVRIARGRPRRSCRRPPDRWIRRGLTGVAIVLALAADSPARAASSDDLERRMQQLQDEMQRLRQELETQKLETQKKATAPPPAPAPAPGERSLLDSVRIGGYGSVRFESNTLDRGADTFTFRRFVLTGDAHIADPLRFAIELELERFTELELERTTTARTGGGLAVTEAVEGSSQTEISLEQAWLEYELAPWLRLRTGMVLVPVGRFNSGHDDNRWNLPRRSLIDRGVSVLPVPAAWSDVGVGFDGDVVMGDDGTLRYQLYVVNGVSLDSEVEKVAQTRAGDTSELALEVELRPTRGTAGLDLKNGKAVTGRLAWSPLPGNEIGASFYAGRYTPDFLPSETLVSLAADGLLTLGPFEAEGEYVYTRFGDVRRVARGFARRIIDRAAAVENDELEAELEFELAGLADAKQGYWLELRYRLFPEWLRGSFLGRHFPTPQLIPTVRWEQAWLEGLVRTLRFAGGQITRLDREDRSVDRITVGLAYRPVPLVVFQAAYEYIWTDKDKSLAAVTNFIPAQSRERDAGAFLFGVAFGF